MSLLDKPWVVRSRPTHSFRPPTKDIFSQMQWMPPLFVTKWLVSCHLQHRFHPRTHWHCHPVLRKAVLKLCEHHLCSCLTISKFLFWYHLMFMTFSVRNRLQRTKHVFFEVSLSVYVLCFYSQHSLIGFFQWTSLHSIPTTVPEERSEDDHAIASSHGMLW